VARHASSSSKGSAKQTDASSIYRARLKRLRSAITEHDLDALLITNPHDISYITPFSGEDSNALVTPKKLIILSDFRFAEELEVVSGLAEIALRDNSMTDLIKRLVDDLSVQSLGIQGEYVSVNGREMFAKALGAKRLKNTTGLLNALRITKDDAEINLIRKAAKIQQDALKALLPTLEPGQRESEVAARLEFEMKARGASGPSFETIVAARANGSLPHARPGATKLAANQPLLIDWGARYRGYCSDMTRTFALGTWPRKVAEIYKVVLDAWHAGAEAVKPGARCADVDAAARDVIARAGYAERFGHGLGHGIGLDIHEDPRLSRHSTQSLRPGMIVTVEPGIYLPGVGGVRIEDDLLVTERGSRNLCSLPKDMDWATL
jgi:Xaa-Pro aminopeptidase